MTAAARAEWIVDSAQGAEVMLGGRSLTSFASANYLSFDPPCVCRSPEFGGRQTLGLPGFLARDADSAALERELATWLGHESAILGKSTFHLLTDLMKTADEEGALFIRRDSYVLTRLAARVVRPSSARLFGSVRDLRRLLLTRPTTSHSGRLGHRSPSVFVDGWSLRGAMPPLAELADVVTTAGGRLIVDDTQALGILGRRVEGTTSILPLGSKGAGTVSYLNVPERAVLLVASLGKALGIPLAFASGREKWIQRLRARGPLLRASSQPALSVVRAARQALAWNGSMGDAARARLCRAVGQFRRLPWIAGAAHSPVQRCLFPSVQHAHALWQDLLDRGTWCLLEHDGRRGGALAFLLTAAHEGPAIARVAATLDSLRGEHLW